MRKVLSCKICKDQKAPRHFIRKHQKGLYYDTCYDCRNYRWSKYMSPRDFGIMLSNTSDNLIKAGIKKF